MNGRAAPSGSTAPHGRVVDASGGPIAGARIVLSRGDDVVAETVTAGDGEFAFAPVPIGGDVPLIAACEAPGMVRATDSWHEPSRPLHLVMTQAAPLSGRVVDENGTALAGVEVTARHSGAWRNLQSTRTANDGGFRFDAIAIGRTTVMAFLDGHQLAVLEHRAGDGGPLEIRLLPASERTIRFRIVGATPEQLAAAKCFFFCPDLELPDSCTHGRPDASGVWRVRGLPNDRLFSSLQVTIPGVECEPRYTWCPAHPESGAYEFVFTVRPIVTQTLRGRVLRDDGTPLGGVAVKAHTNRARDPRCVLDRDGAFTIDTPATDSDPVWFELASAEFVLDGPGLPEFVSPKVRHMYGVRLPCEAEIVMTALPAASVRVVCTLADGAPAAAAFVTVDTTWQAAKGPFTSQLATAVTDREGVVQIAGLHPQPGAAVFVRVIGDGWRARSADVHLAAGNLVELRIVAPATGAVAGVVRDATGRALAGEPIGVYSDDAQEAEWPVADATTDRDGRFRFATLAAGTYSFGPSLPERAPPWRSAPFLVTAGTTLQHDCVAARAADGHPR